MPYTCKILAPFENCLNAQMYPSGVQSCVPKDWEGVPTEEECTREFACCWDPQAPIQCYKPGSSNIQFKKPFCDSFQNIENFKGIWGIVLYKRVPQ